MADVKGTIVSTERQTEEYALREMFCPTCEAIAGERCYVQTTRSVDMRGVAQYVEFLHYERIIAANLAMQVDDEQASLKEIASATELLIAAGYVVEKRDQPEPVKEISYAQELANTITGLHADEVVIPFPDLGIPARLNAEFLDRIQYNLAGCPEEGYPEVFVEIDRNLLSNEALTPMQSELYALLYPVAIRIDGQGDLILHVTSGDWAQQSASEIVDPEEKS